MDANIINEQALAILRDGEQDPAARLYEALRMPLDDAVWSRLVNALINELRSSFTLAGGYGRQSWREIAVGIVNFYITDCLPSRQWFDLSDRIRNPDENITHQIEESYNRHRESAMLNMAAEYVINHFVKAIEGE